MDPMEFQGRMLDATKAREQLEGGAKVGEADFELALFDVPDTGKPVGVSSRQVIDRGAFRGLIEERDFSSKPVPYYLDHGHAPVFGFVDQRLKLGKTDSYREEDTALVMRGLFNLEKQIAREAFSDVVFDPGNTPHSYRWTLDDTYRGGDGFDHVRTVQDIVESSLCGRGAQMGTGVRPDTITMRSEAELKAWVSEHPETARTVLEFLTASVEYTPDGTAASATMRMTSLDSLASAVRSAWYAAKDYGSMIEDVLVNDASMNSGTIVCREDAGKYVQYTWTKGTDGYEFSEEGSEVESAWVSARAELVRMMLMDKANIADVLRTDEKVRTVMEAAMAEANAPDPTTEWYDRLFKNDASTWEQRASA
jgi:hypothetical protein